MLRLSLARALLREPSILILDETTSMIEPSLEVKILDDIRAHYPQMTLILISHQDHPREWISHQITF
jgi:ABC-type bacteriocin/lantibiotic exporter with double-glycine peptidase domain